MLLLTLCLFQSCEEEQATSKLSPTLAEKEIHIPETTRDKSELTYNRNVSLWKEKNRTYSGYAVSKYPDGSIEEKFGIYKGKKQNKLTKYFPDGNLKQVSHYHNGKLHGEKKTWSSDTSHVLLSHLNYHSGKAHGVQKKWYVTGERYKILNLNMGKEEGIQQAYRKNGVLYANYEARNGRIFGLKKSNLCFTLENEEVQGEE